MNSELNNFFREEQKRVFEPGPYFTQRVMASLASGRAVLTQSVWDFLPNAMRPVLGLAMAVLFAVLAIQILAPVEPPSQSAVYADQMQELSPHEQLLLTDPQMEVSAAQLDDLILWEPMQ
jgi:hypothetical protein